MYHVLVFGMLGTATVFVNSARLGYDSFVVPKIAVLVLTAVVLAAMGILSAPRLRFERPDFLLGAALALGAVSSTYAVNPHYAVTAFGSFSASTILYWVARHEAHRGRRQRMLGWVVFTIGLICVSVLVEAYTGLEFSRFSHRPAGPIGNRNRMAHLIVVVLPSAFILLWREDNPRHLAGHYGILGLFGLAITLSRTRGAWVATIIVIGVALLGVVLRASLVGSPRARLVRRVSYASMMFLVGIGIGAYAPNTLRWNSDTPLRDSIHGLVDYRTGSGHGRVEQYKNTLAMWSDRPLLGVGPGNWRVWYPEYARPGDPTLIGGLLPTGRFPQSEWLGAGAERGLMSLTVLLVWASLLCRRWIQGIHSNERRNAANGIAGIASLSGVFAIGLVDAIVMTPVAGYVVPVVLGALSPTRSEIWAVRRTWILPVYILAGWVFADARVREIYALRILGVGEGMPAPEAVERATNIDSGNVMLEAGAAVVFAANGQCVDAEGHFSKAKRLYPAIRLPPDLVSDCAQDVWER